MSLVQATSILEVLRQRIERLDSGGSSVEPGVAPDQTAIVILSPAAQGDRAEEALTYFGWLELRPVAKDTTIAYDSREDADNALNGAPERKAGFETARFDEQRPSGERMTGWVIVEAQPLITGDEVEDAAPFISPDNDENFEIRARLKPEAAVRMGEWTGNHLGAYLAIMIDGQVRSAPVINGHISDALVIQGNFDRAAAENLAFALSGGALPYPIRITEKLPVSSLRWVVPPLISTGILGFIFLAGLFILFRLSRLPFLKS